MADKYIPTASRTFDGKRYSVVTVYDTKGQAERRADAIRGAGRLARAIIIPKAPKGRAGYTRIRWAVYSRRG